MFFRDISTLTQSLQLAALFPCIFITAYLLIVIQNKKFAVIPVMYFLSITAGVLYRLVAIAYLGDAPPTNIAFFLMFVDSLMPALSFLLIFQLTLNKIPAAAYWGILAVPAIAVSPFIYGAVKNPIVCTENIDLCFSSLSALRLNKAVVGSFIFMLLTVIFARRSIEIEGSDVVKKHKYWMIICLIIYNVILIGVEVFAAGDVIDSEKYHFAKAMIKISFVYMIMTSIFRVFSDQFVMQQIQVPAAGKNELSQYELSVAARAEKILKEEKIYREAGFNRASFAKRLGVREHLLSRIINMHFQKSFSELANEYRLEEAKSLLASTASPVTTIAYDVGFSSITSFNRVFKESTGSSPSEYREAAAPNNNSPAKTSEAVNG